MLSSELEVFVVVLVVLMDDSSYKLNFDLGKKNEIHHYSYRIERAS